MAMAIEKVRLSTPAAVSTKNHNAAPSTSTPAFRARDVGYFDPNSDLPPVETKENHQIYHNVFSFTQRLRVKADIMDAAILRNSVDQCFLGKADT